MKISKYGSTPKQIAYVQQLYGAKGRSKADIAMAVGYSRHVANTPKSKIESKVGFHNAVLKLAQDSNNLALAAMAEFKARGFKDFSNKDLVAALNAIGGAWDKFNKVRTKPEEDPTKNKLRTIILQRVENQTVNTKDVPAIASKEEVQQVEEEINEEVKPEEDPGF